MMIMMVILINISSYPVMVVTTELQNYQERSIEWCLSVPPQCSKYTLKQRVINKTNMLNKSRIVRVCCGNSFQISFHTIVDHDLMTKTVCFFLYLY